MSQPIPPTVLPNDRLARRGSFYEIPFTFTVPDTLLPFACSHETTDNESVRKAHLLPPPSLDSYKTTGGVLIDDLAPKRARVSYRVHARLRRSLDENRSILLERTRLIRIIPTRTEEPPLFVKENDPYNRLCQKTNVYRGIPGVDEVVGRLQAATEQPLSLRMPHPHAQEGGFATTTASVNLRFDPTTEGGPPPQLYSIKSKLCAFTFFGATPYETIPRPDECYDACKEHTHCTNTTRLASRQLGSMVWVKHGFGSIAATPEPSNQFLSRGTTQTCKAPSASSHYEDEPTFYTMSLQIPITLPWYTSRQSSQKIFTPTFNSCLISRCYSLELQLSYKSIVDNSRPPSTIVAASTSIARHFGCSSRLNLRIPLQISTATTSPSFRDASTSYKPVMSSPGDKQIGDLTGELAPPCMDYPTNANEGSSHPPADQTTLGNEEPFSVASSNLDSAKLPGNRLCEGFDCLAAEDCPPAYVSAFRLAQN